MTGWYDSYLVDGRAKPGHERSWGVIIDTLLVIPL